MIPLLLCNIFNQQFVITEETKRQNHFKSQISIVTDSVISRAPEKLSLPLFLFVALFSLSGNG